MMSLFHLFTVLLFLISFSGQPKTAAVTAKTPAEETIVFADKEENEEFIPWVPHRRLTWEDFLCEPKRNSDAVASTSTSLGIAYQIKNNQLTYQVTCNFSKKRSWGLVRTPYILAHEQAHFDITEIYARKLHQALQDYKLNRKTFKEDINTIYERVVIAKESFQKLYDGQTDHSRKSAKQQEWLERIDEILDETSPYADYP
jgi:hypothetical protein